MMDFSKFLTTLNEWERPRTERERLCMEFGYASGALNQATDDRDRFIAMAQHEVTQGE